MTPHTATAATGPNGSNTAQEPCKAHWQPDSQVVSCGFRAAQLLLDPERLQLSPISGGKLFYFLGDSPPHKFIFLKKNNQVLGGFFAHLGTLLTLCVAPIHGFSYLQMSAMVANSIFLEVSSEALPILVSKAWSPRNNWNTTSFKQVNTRK